MATSEGGAAGALVRGIRPEDLRRRPLLANHVVQGSLADFDDDGIAVGDRLARRLGVAVGSPISVISPQGTATAFGTMPLVRHSIDDQLHGPDDSTVGARHQQTPPPPRVDLRDDLGAPPLQRIVERKGRRSRRREPRRATPRRGGRGQRNSKEGQPG